MGRKPAASKKERVKSETQKTARLEKELIDTQGGLESPDADAGSHESRIAKCQ
jgi:hypothetical protein